MELRYNCRGCDQPKGAEHKDCSSAGTVQMYQCAASDIPAIERRRTARLDSFDSQTSVITVIRGADYGPPRQDFERAQAIFKAIIGDSGQNVDPAVRHVFYLMAVKLARLRLTPTHLDSWIDIAGYARCGVSVTDDLLPGGSRYVTKS